MNIKLVPYIVILLILTILIPFTLVHADTDLENADLVRIINVLNSLNPIIDESERQQDKSTRVQFQYEALRADLNKIKTGIAEKLHMPTIEPRAVIPIQGDYLIQKRKHI